MLRTVAGKNWGTNSNTLLTLYKQFIKPVMDYGAVVTAEACKTDIKMMEIAQRQASRFALRPSPRTSNKLLHEKANITPLGDSLIRLKHKAVNSFRINSMTEALRVATATVSKITGQLAN